MTIKTCNYLVIASLVLTAIVLIAVVFSKKTVQIEDQDGKVSTGEIKNHLLPGKAA